MRFPPPEEVASWPAPDFIHPEIRRPYLIPVNLILIGTASIMVFLRLYARIFVARAVQLDDWLVVIALIPAIGLTATVSLAAKYYGWQYHIWDWERDRASQHDLIVERAISWASQMLYLWSSSLTKLSLLLFYRKIFVTQTMQRFVLGMIIFVICFFSACVLTLLLECRPLTLYWHILVVPKGTGGICIDEGDILLVAGVINVFIDLIILVLPIRTVINLNIRWPLKLQVLAVFMAGTLVVVCATIRVYATDITTRGTYDVTWYGYLVWMWVGIEVDVGLICASVPACKSLFKAWGQRVNTARGTKNSAQRGYAGPDSSLQKSTGTGRSGNYSKMSSSDGTAHREVGNSWAGGKKKPLPTTSQSWPSPGEEEYDLEYVGNKSSVIPAPFVRPSMRN